VKELSRTLGHWQFRGVCAIGQGGTTSVIDSVKNDVPGDVE
jgi:hypothetical protein